MSNIGRKDKSSSKSKEPLVQNLIAEYIQPDLADNQKVTTEENIGQAHLEFNTAVIADVVVRDNRINNSVLAIECKGDVDIRKGIGQALTYKYIVGAAGIAGYNISQDYLDVIEQLPIYCFNVTGNRLKDVKVESRSTNYYTTPTPDERVKDMLQYIKHNTDNAIRRHRYYDLEDCKSYNLKDSEVTTMKKERDKVEKQMEKLKDNKSSLKTEIRELNHTKEGLENKIRELMMLKKDM